MHTGVLGVPEATYLIERLVDLAAEKTGIDRIEIRRQNFIPLTDFPYQSPLGLVYTEGAYDQCVDGALKKFRYGRICETKS